MFVCSFNFTHFSFLIFSIYLLTILVVATVSNAQTLERQTCITTRSSVDVDMTGANAVIGGLFEMRRSILGGYACGEPHKGMDYFIINIIIIIQNEK